MSTYLLVLTPQPIPDCDYPKVFTHLIGCNPAYDGLTWNGTCRFFKPQGEDFWPSLIQMQGGSRATGAPGAAKRGHSVTRHQI